MNRQVITAKACRGNVAIAIDSNNLPHIAYSEYEVVRSDSPVDLVYASFNGTEWQKQIVTNGGGKIDLALDANDNPSIIYKDSHGNLMYANWNGSNWIILKVDDYGDGSLKLDSKGNPHIAYNWLGGDLRYASLVGSDWNIQTVDSSRYEIMDFGTSLCLDKNDVPYILYSFTTGQSSNSISTVKYAHLQKNGWNIQTVVSKDELGLGNLALDAAGNPHFTYPLGHPRSTFGHVTIIHLFLNGSHWDSDIVANNIEFSRSGCLIIGSNDTIYDSYFTYSEPDSKSSLQLAKFTNGKWTAETILNGTFIMGASPILFDSTGKLHIAYTDVSVNSTSHNSYLYYATSATPQLSTGAQSSPFSTLTIIVLAITVIAVSAGLLFFGKHRRNNK